MKMSEPNVVIINNKDPCPPVPIVRTSLRASSVESFKVMDVLQRANQLQAQGYEVLHCEVGQPETGAPRQVVQAAMDALTSPPPRSILGYTDAFGLIALRQAIAKHYQHKYGVSIDTKRIVITTGSSGAFLLAFTAAFDSGDLVAIASSGYPCYRNILGALGCTLVNIPINSQFKLTAKELLAEVHRRQEQGERKIQGLILSSPSNPTGAMLTPTELQELCRVCEQENILFISDEIYHGITYEKEEATALLFSSRVFVINSFSKYYSMSGWRLGWMVIPDDETLNKAINSLQQNMYINAPTISQTAALKCWDAETIEELEMHRTKYKTSRQIILNALASIPDKDSFHISPADGGFYVYVDLGHENVSPGFGSVAMCAQLLEEEKVAFTPGTDFEWDRDGLGDQRFRISYAGGINTVEQAMIRFQRFWPHWIARVRENKEKTCK